MEEGAWDDFANNLATDLAPFITLFGEQVTKQYLSESIGFLDCFIFALAPLGILTAVVSAIRVSGSPTLRAFIGRAQEGPGNAEVEPELWNDGGISRVFGRPMLLEVVVEGDDSETQEPVINFICDVKNSWEERKPKSLASTDILDSDPDLRLQFMKSSPNLSLNKGIKKRHQVWFYAVATVGVFLVLGVLIFGAITVYVVPSLFQRDGKPVAPYSFPCFFIGTIAVDCGMFLCAKIIERASLERFYSPKEGEKGDIFWLQPGGQKVGDQVFNAFVGSLNGEDRFRDRVYVKSIKNPQGPQASTLWLAVVVNMSGFVLQFVGARGLHASVTLAWLGATLLMAILRASLRASRMNEGDNLMAQPELQKLPRTLSYGYELDWLSIFLKEKSEDRGFHLITSPTPRAQLEQLKVHRWKSQTGLGRTILKTRDRLAILTGPEHLCWDNFPVRDTAQQLKNTIEGIMELLRIVPNRYKAKTVIKWPIYMSCGKNENAVESAAEKHVVYIKRSSIDARWEVELSMLEALLGLWTWSLVRQRSSELADPNSAIEQVQYRVLCSRPLEEMESPNLPEIAYWIPRADKIWIVKTERGENRSFFTHVERDCVRITWHDRTSFERAAHGSQLHLCVKTENSLLTMVAHDLFMSFLSAATSRGSDAPFNKAFDDATHISPNSESMGNSHLIGNSMLDGWTEKFEECSLGSREDALLCILPIIYERPKTFRVHGGLQLVRQQIQLLKAEDSKEGLRLTISLFNFIICVLHHERFDLNSHRRIPVEVFPCVGAMSNNDMISVKLLKALKSDEDIWAQLYSLVNLVGDKTFERLFGCSWRQLTRKLRLKISSVHTAPIKEDLAMFENFWKSSDKMSDIKANSSDTRNALLWAVSNQQRLLFYILLQKGDHIDVKGVEDDDTYLAWAAREGNFNMVEWLLEEGADINIRCDLGYSRPSAQAVLIAAQKNHWHIVEMMISREADLDVLEDPAALFLFVAECGQLSLLEKLLDRGLDINAKARGDSANALISASAIPEGTASVPFLIGRGALLDAQDTYSRTALMRAARAGILPTIEILLKAGADHNLKDRLGRTALDIAHERHVLLVDPHVHPSEAYSGPARPEVPEMIERWIAQQSGAGGVKIISSLDS